MALFEKCVKNDFYAKVDDERSKIKQNVQCKNLISLEACVEVL